MGRQMGLVDQGGPHARPPGILPFWRVALGTFTMKESFGDDSAKRGMTKQSGQAAGVGWGTLPTARQTLTVCPADVLPWAP